ncbi:MAG: branched-chain amino acid aminotransferase [Saprospiraceae bacterium]|nr:branched-chain amino acid aminotransferase [Saprospiraceae bacterium]
MKQEIKITITSNSRLSQVNFDDLPFGRVFSDHMFIADYKDGKWINPRIEPFGAFSAHPAMMALHYGQSVFEGMKASKSADGQPFLFRPEVHARRLNNSARRICMPDFPEDLFVEALHQLVSLDRDWIPINEGSALYIRPFMFATDEFIGVRPSASYKMIIFTCPVGPYYPKPVRLWVEQKYVRAVNGGTGEAKAAGNYAGALYPAKLAQERGFDQVMWMDAHDFKFVQEVGTMNIFFVIGDKILTPATDGSILKGITRDCILTILRDKGYHVEERPIRIDEIVMAHQSGQLKEAFGAGTAAVVSHVEAIGFGEILMELPPIETREIGEMVKAEINGMRAGIIEDKHGWVVPVKISEKVMG